MKHLLFTILCLISSVDIYAQGPFKGKFVDESHEIFIVINLYDKDVVIPDQEIYGEMDGFVGSRRNTLVWMITDSKIISDKKAEIEIVNDYGSEDADAELIFEDANTLVYNKKHGSNLRFSKNGKWIRMPSKLTFIRADK